MGILAWLGPQTQATLVGWIRNMLYGGFAQRLFLQSATVDLQEAVWTHMLANPDAASLAIQALRLVHGL